MPFSTQADFTCVVGFAPHNAVTTVLNIGVVCVGGGKGSKFNVTVIILPSQRENLIKTSAQTAQCSTPE